MRFSKFLNSASVVYANLYLITCFDAANELMHPSVDWGFIWPFIPFMEF